MRNSKEKRYFRIVEEGAQEGGKGGLQELVSTISQRHQYIYIDISEGRVWGR